MPLAPTDLADLHKKLGRAIALLEAKRPDYVKGREFYDGTRAEVSASALVEKLIGKSAASFPVSFAHIPVDVVCDKVTFSSITAADATADEALTKVADANDLEDELDDWVLKAGYFGDYYVIVDPTEEEVTGTAAVITADGIRWVGSSPLTTIVAYDGGDERSPLFGAKVWQDGKTYRALLYFDDATVRLVTEEGAKLEAERFELDYEEKPEEAYILHPGGRMLIKHLAVGSKPYGTPLHKKAWGPQDAITKVSAINLNNVDAIGLPSRYALLDAAAELDDDIDADFGDDGPGEGDATRPPSVGSRLKALAGTIATLPGVKSVGTFDNSPSNEFLVNLEFYLRAMAVATGIPLFEFDLKGDQPSGESRRRAEARANRTAKKLARSVAAFLKELGDTTLGLLGMATEVSAAFRPVETATDQEGITLVASKIKAGVPVRQALLEAGYGDEQVEEWYPTGTPAVTPDLVALLATALAALGNAKTLGVITDVELRDMLPTILTAARNEGGVVGAPAPAIDAAAVADLKAALLPPAAPSVAA
jgi:hypothetical protein